MLNSGYNLSKGDSGIILRQTVWIGRYSGVQLSLRCVFEHYVQFGQRFDDLVQSDNVGMVHFLHAGYFARQKTTSLGIQSRLVEYLHGNFLYNKYKLLNCTQLLCEVCLLYTSDAADE